MKRPDWAFGLSLTARGGVLLLALVGLILAGCRSSSAGAAPTFAPLPTQVPSPGSTFTVERSSIVETIEGRGRLEAKQEALLMFPLEGVLRAVYVAPGDKVQAGGLLAELDAPGVAREVLDRQFELSAAQLELERTEITARAQADLAQVELTLAQLALAQAQSGQTITITQQLADAQLKVDQSSTWLATSTSDLEAAIARRQVDLAQARAQNAQDAELLPNQIQVSIAELHLDQVTTTNRYEAYLAYAQLALAEVQYAQTLLATEREAGRSVEEAQAQLQIAQISSNLLTSTYQLDVDAARIQVERVQTLYQLATEQLSNTQLLAPFDGIIVAIEKRSGDQIEAYDSIGVIADPAELWIVATVLSEYINRIAVGQPVAIRLDAFPNRSYSGSVLQIASQSDLWQGRSAYEVTIAFEEGQDVPAIIRMGADVSIAGRSKDDVLVVPAQAIMTIAGQQYVEVVGEGGQVERVPVETGISNGSETEIVAGLQTGQVIRIP